VFGSNSSLTKASTFLKFEFFNRWTAQGAELRRRAKFKFGRNPSNHGRDMAIFPFLQRAQCVHWHRCLECTVQQNGGHIEHLFK